ncbi:hypothetical protein Tco_1531414, partial [Tanacetum coccineum]
CRSSFVATPSLKPLHEIAPPIPVVASVPALGVPLVVVPALVSRLPFLISFGCYPLATFLLSLPTFAPIHCIKSHQMP